MADDVIEQIVSAVQVKIAGVTIANGAQVDVAECVRPTRLGGYSPRHMLVVLEQDDWEDAGSAPFGYVRRTLPLEADLFVKPGDKDETPVDTLINLAAAEIEKKIMADQTLDGLVESIMFAAPESFVSRDGAFEGRRIRFDAVYLHLATDPFTAA